MRNQDGKLVVVAGRSSRNLEAVAPNGTVLILRTSGDYTLAGLTKSRYTGEWKIAIKGSSADSVRSRTITQANRDGAAEWTVVSLVDPGYRVPQPLKDYFAADAAYHTLAPKTPQVTSAFIPGQGWIPLEFTVPAVPRYLRIIQRLGATSVAVSAYGRVPDFTIDELLKVDRTPLLGGALIGSRTWPAK